MNYLNTLFLLFLVGTISTMDAQDCDVQRYQDRVFSEIKVTKDIVYGQVDPYEAFERNTLEDIKLDFYEPVGDSLEQRPLVVMCFGGAFLVGTKEDSDMVAWCDSLAHRGYACASIEYRLGFNPFRSRSSERAVYRAVQDLRAAIRFLQEDPDNQGFNIDPNTIFVGGESAGAITALHTAFLTEEADRPDATYGNFFSSSDRSDLGCMDCSGNDYDQPVNIKGILSMWGALNHPDVIDEDEIIPTLLVHGTLDQTVPNGRGRPFNSPFFPRVYGSKKINQRMDELGIYNEYLPYNGNASHTVYGTPNISFPNDKWDEIYTTSHQFLTKVLDFDTPTPVGYAVVQRGSTNSYTVTPQAGSSYCWTVEGGTIVNEDENKINVIWDSEDFKGLVQVIETNYYDMQGAMASLEVDITAPAPLVVNPVNTISIKSLNINTLDFSFETKKEDHTQIYLVDMNGRTVYQNGQTTFVGINEVSVPVENLPRGMYVLVVEGTDYLLQHKFVK